MILRYIGQLIVVSIVVGRGVNSWSTIPCKIHLRPHPQRLSCNRKHHNLSKSSQDLDNTELIEDDNPENNKEVEWGVSYIGGDPCGSKLNDDPFDTKSSKPGLPDDMKARIEALAERKKQEN